MEVKRNLSSIIEKAKKEYSGGNTFEIKELTKDEKERIIKKERARWIKTKQKKSQES